MTSVIPLVAAYLAGVLTAVVLVGGIVICVSCDDLEREEPRHAPRE